MSSHSPLLVLRALGALISYPQPVLRAALPEIADAIRTSPLLQPRERDAVLALVAELRATEALTAEERYVDLFDRSRATSLHLFEHLHGEARDRGQAMVALKHTYERAGFELTTAELPDFLPVPLEYLSCRDMQEAQDMLGDCADILRAIGTALLRRDSRYAAVIQALLAIAGEKPLEAAAARNVAAEHEDLDREWAEQPAFAPAVPSHRPGP